MLSAGIDCWRKNRGRKQNRKKTKTDIANRREKTAAASAGIDRWREKEEKNEAD